MTNEEFMRQALLLAARGRGAVEPNPMVGCVIVKDGRVIGQGHHERFGGPHAEANALAACTQPPAGATAYVSLEPCCHTNKKTPPCVPRLIEAKLARVVVGCVDPNPAVAGNGIAQLRSAGIEVTAPVLESSARQLNAAFFALTCQGRPYVTLKWAQSADGKIGGPSGRRIWISNRASQRIVHELRARCDAILVGINTVLADDPLLTVRGVEESRPLLRAVIDSELRISVDSRLVQSARQHPLRIYCASAVVKSDRATKLRELGVKVVDLDSDPAEIQDPGNWRLVLNEMLADLAGEHMTHLLVEPGPTLARSFLQKHLTDRVWIFRSPNTIGDPTAPAAASIEYPATGEAVHEGDRLTEYLNPSSPVFFALEPSADFVQCGGAAAYAAQGDPL